MDKNQPIPLDPKTNAESCSGDTTKAATSDGGTCTKGPGTKTGFPVSAVPLPETSSQGAKS